MTLDYISINNLTADFRLRYTPRAQTREQRIAKLEQYLTEMSNFSWTTAYKTFAAELAALRTEAH